MTDTKTLADQALEAFTDYEKVQQLHRDRNAQSMALILKGLLKDVLDLDTEPHEDNFAIVEHFGFSYRLLAGEPALYGWWRCDRCKGKGDWFHITCLGALGEVEKQYRKHRETGSCWPQRAA